MSFDFDAECGCVNCNGAEPGDRVILSAYPVLGEIGVVVSFDQERSEHEDTSVYIVNIEKFNRAVPVLGAIMWKSPYQGEPLEDVPNVSA